MADWANLLEEVLDLVAKRITHVTDYVSFGAVCSTWRSIALKNHVRLPSQIPILMVPNNNQEKEEETRRFYSLTERKVYDFQLPVHPKHRCRGSDYGWLATIDDESFDLRLLNPFSRERKEINLPPLTQLPIRDEDFVHTGCFLHKVVLSSNPSSTLDFVVLAIFGEWRDLAFCRPGDQTWTAIQREGLLKHVSDAIFYNEKFYVVDLIGKVMACDVGHPHPSLTEVAPPIDEDSWDKRFLVESLGELLQLQRILDFYKTDSPFMIGCDELIDETYSTSWFHVYKLDSTERKWIKLESLGDQMLFVGDNTPLSLSASIAYISLITTNRFTGRRGELMTWECST